MKFLLADDSKTIRRLLKTYLGSMGFEDLVEAQDGEEALEMLKAEIPDVLILDWNMPKKSGIEVLKSAREEGEFKELKILMCTSMSEKENVIEAIKAGANNYMTKPFSEDILKEKLGALGII